MPVTLVASLIEPKSLEPHEPSHDRIRNFESLTGSPYNPNPNPNHTPTEILPPSETVSVACPKCVDSPRMSVAWWSPDGKGFAQDGFQAACSACSKSFTKATIGVRRLCDELTLRRAGAPIAFSSVFPPSPSPLFILFYSFSFPSSTFNDASIDLTFMAGRHYWTLSPGG